MKTYERRRSGRGTNLEIVNLDEVCRLCLGREEREEHRIPIFGNRDHRDKDGGPLALRIMACVPLEVMEDDGLPNTICKPCHYQLEQCYIFRKKCTNSDAKLRLHLKQLDQTDEPVTVAIPEEDEADTDAPNITLPQEDAPSDCTIKQEMMCEDHVSNNEKQQQQSDASQQNNEEYLQVRVLPSAQSELTQVEVTTGEGSVLLMELTTEDPVVERSESGEMLIFKCEHCPKAFSRMVELRRHISVHSLQRGITCNVCDKWFASHSSFTRHERIHTGIKPYECGVCARRFVQKEILLRHMLVHAEVKPFNCTVCKKGFTQRQTFQMHMAKHAPGQRSVCLHKCPLCTKVFCHASGLSRHLASHTGRVYKCLNCDKLFNDKSSLRRHHKITGHQST